MSTAAEFLTSAVALRLEEYDARGNLTVPDVPLPPGFVPRQAALLFLKIGDRACEVFLPHQVRYTGSDAKFEEVQRQPVTLNAARLVLRADEGLMAAVARVAALLAQAGEATGQEGEDERRAPVRAERLTDLDAVAGLVAHNGPKARVSEAALLAGLGALVRGQEQALKTVAGRVSAHLARTAPRRPLTLFAVGPTGVGKTRTAEVLPEVIHDLDPDGERLGYLRLDMSEYQEAHRVSQLLGAPQGYVGHDRGSELVNVLSENPRAIVLFDEIEKAHPGVLKAIMNAMDAGRLSAPALGRSIDCRKAVFFFTSNLDAGSILAVLDATAHPDDERTVDEVCRRSLLRSGIAPELVGRIAAFLVYRPLPDEALAEIVALAIAAVAAEYGLRLAYIEPALVARVLTESRGNGLGARPFEYHAGALFSPAFADAAQSGDEGPFHLAEGPPVACQPDRPPEEKS